MQQFAGPSSVDSTNQYDFKNGRQKCPGNEKER